MAENLNDKKPDQEPFRFFSLSHQDQLGLGFNGFSKNPPSPPPPCVEVLLSNPEVSSSSVKYTMESIYLIGDLTLHKGRVSTKDVFGASNSDLVPGKYEGGLKLWEGSLDLVKTLYNEIQEGKLSLKGKRVLEFPVYGCQLGCGHGLPGIFACLEGAAVIHFQDFNAEVLQCLTIPNVKANLAKDPLLQHSSHTNEIEKKTSSEIRFFCR
ncbi:histidine protein methyltransferase 1 [Cinnamomum micranthum f. kanehirae]|uniref:protein-histidine N-methyltransferase n=1 Tax=Cinnamomum micranthum f. kanehirae TaxID=337451 RepID=A0A3S3N2Q9_9MAGN|nr:histidine protein methyltransferase 1 [Cinnamomum micranthum f. kanehirae]